MCLAPAPGLLTKFSSATVRAEAGESARGVASRAGRQEGRRRCREVGEGWPEAQEGRKVGLTSTTVEKPKTLRNNQ
jgi:hypothetical protein